MVQKKRKTMEIVEDFDDEIEMEEEEEEVQQPKRKKVKKKPIKRKRKEVVAKPVKLDFKNYLNVYEFKTVLPGSGEEIKFRPITTGQLKRLLIYENETDPMVIEGALDDLISSCIINDDFSINNIYLQDRFYLLVEIRKKSKGEKYQFQYQCSDCDTQTMMNIDLDSLNVDELSEDYDDIVKIDDNISVRLSHITRGMQKKAFQSIKKMKGLSDTQKATEIALATHATSIMSIITPDGEIEEPSLVDTRYLLDNISTEGYGYVRDWFDTNNFGLDFTIEIGCSNCDKKEVVDIPVENFFF